MLSYNTEIQKVIDDVKTDLAQQSYVQVDYPSAISEDLWDFYMDNIVIPPVQGSLYFIYDENKNLLYIGKTKALGLALRNHLIRRTSKSTASILNDIQKRVSNSDVKQIYLKVVDVEPVELANTIKPHLVKEFKPSLVKRVS